MSSADKVPCIFVKLLRNTLGLKLNLHEKREIQQEVISLPIHFFSLFFFSLWPMTLNRELLRTVVRANLPVPPRPRPNPAPHLTPPPPIFSRDFGHHRHLSVTTRCWTSFSNCITVVSTGPRHLRQAAGEVDVTGWLHFTVLWSDENHDNHSS